MEQIHSINSRKRQFFYGEKPDNSIWQNKIRQIVHDGESHTVNKSRRSRMRNGSFISNGKLRIWDKGFIDCIRNRQQKSSGYGFDGLSPDIRARRSCKLRKEFQTNHKPVQQNLHRAIIGSVTASIFYTKKKGECPI